MTDRPALLLDLDGTLTDSVYQHAIAWHKALELGGINLSVWRIHRRIGMSGGLLADSLARETGHELSEKEAAKRKRAHARLVGAPPADGYSRARAPRRCPAGRGRTSSSAQAPTGSMKTRQTSCDTSMS